MKKTCLILNIPITSSSFSQQKSEAKENFNVQETLELPNLNNADNIDDTEFLMIKDNGAV